MNFGENIQFLRKQFGMTQEELADHRSAAIASVRHTRELLRNVVFMLHRSGSRAVHSRRSAPWRFCKKAPGHNSLLQSGAN